jgi:hypothetical protein
MIEDVSNPEPTWGSIAGIGMIWIMLVLALASLDLRPAIPQGPGVALTSEQVARHCSPADTPS